MTQVATLEAAEAIRGRLERALLQEEVNLASENGRGLDRGADRGDSALVRGGGAERQAPALDSRERAGIAAELRNELIGLGAIAERMLADPVAQEWMINGPRRLFRDTGERIERVPDLVFDDDRQVRAFVERLLEQVEGKRLDRITPRKSRRSSGRLPADGGDPARLVERAHDLHDPPLPARRRHPRRSRRLGFLSEQAAAFLAACVRAGKNIVISGRVSSGKTTLLNALGRAVPGAERVVVCESSAELQLPAILPTASGTRPGRRAPTASLRCRSGPRLRRAAHEPDRILVGECRGPETMAMLWSFATGHAHDERARRVGGAALRNLVRFALTAGARIEAEQALDWVRDVDLVVHCDRPRSFTGSERRFLPRRIDEVVEVTGVEGRRSTLNPLFDGAGSELRWLNSSLRHIDEPRAGRLPCGMTRRLGTVLIVLLLAIAAGCDGGDGEVATQPLAWDDLDHDRRGRPQGCRGARRCAATTGCPATSSGGIGCRRGQHKRRGPALVTLRQSAADRRKRGVRIRTLANRLEISSIELDPPSRRRRRP